MRWRLARVLVGFGTALAALFLCAPAHAQNCPSPFSPQFTQGGTVFGRSAPQWNTYIGSKVDQINGCLLSPTLVNPNIVGTLFVQNLTVPGNFTVGGAFSAATVNVLAASDLLVNGTPLTLAMLPGPISYSQMPQQPAYTLFGNPTGARAVPQPVAVPLCEDVSGQHLNFDPAAGLLCGTSAGAVAPTANISTLSGPLDQYAGRTLSILDFASASGQSTTGTIGAASHTLTLASAIDLGQVAACSVVNLALGKCGVLVVGAGSPASAPGTPAGLALASFRPTQTPTGTLASGSRLVQNVSIMAGIDDGDTITGTNIPGGTTIVSHNVTDGTIQLSAAATGSGSVTLTIQDAGGGSYQYKAASIDQNGGYSIATAAATTAAGPAKLGPNNINCLVITPPGSGPTPAGYAIWRSPDGGTTWQPFWIASLPGSGACDGSNGPIWDMGQPAIVWPAWLPATPPVAAGADWLRSYVTAGAGTTTLTLHDPAITAVSGALAVHDDTQGWLDWIAALNSTRAQGTIPGTQPATGQPVVINTTQPGIVTASGVRVTAMNGATVLPWGGAFANGTAAGLTGVGALTFAGGGGRTPTFTLAANLERGQSCVRLVSNAGATLGSYLYFTATAPGGSAPYTFVSPIKALSCAGGTGVQLADATPVMIPLQFVVGTVTGATVTNDTVVLTLTGDAAATITYTVNTASPGYCTANFCAARGLALLINQTVANGGLADYGISAWATASPAAAVYLTIPNALAGHVTPTYSATGATSIAQATVSNSTVYTLPLLDNVGLDGAIYIDMHNAIAVGNGTTAQEAFGVQAALTTHSSFRGVRGANCGAAFLAQFNYDLAADDIRATGCGIGTPNIASVADIYFIGGTRTHASKLSSLDSYGFSNEYLSESLLEVTDVASAGSGAGRGGKLGAVAGWSIKGYQQSNSAFTGLACAYGTAYGALSGAHIVGNVGVAGNSEGIWGADTFCHDNSFSDSVVTGNAQYDVALFPSDTNNLFPNLTASTIRGCGASGPCSIFNVGLALYTNVRYAHP